MTASQIGAFRGGFSGCPEDDAQGRGPAAPARSFSGVNLAKTGDWFGMVTLHFCIARKTVHPPGKLDIECRKPGAIMGGQRDIDDIVDVCPFRMVVELFRRQCRA